MKLVYILFLVLLFSCDVDPVLKQVCADKTEAGYSIHNYSEFSKFENTLTDGDIEYYSYYKNYFPDIKPTIFSWGVQIKLSNICNSDVPLIEFSVLLHQPDSIFIPVGSIREDPYSQQTAKLFSIDNIYFDENREHQFSGDYGGGSVSIYASIFFNIPSKGSFSADSAYFFSNLDYMSIKIKAHKPK
jgi:hypothetical protein